MRSGTPSMVMEDGSAEKASVRPVLGAPIETRPRSLNSARTRPLSRAMSSAAAGVDERKARPQRTRRMIVGEKPGGKARFKIITKSPYGFRPDYNRTGTGSGRPRRML